MQRRATFAELAIMKVAVISGGPSSLVTLKYLCEVQQYLSYEPVKAVLFEYQNDVGGTFLARAYEDAEARESSWSLEGAGAATSSSTGQRKALGDGIAMQWPLVMVVGCGETGADVAYLAATHPEVDRVVLCHNDGFYFTLKVRRHPPYHCTTPSPLTQVAAKRNPGPVLLPILGRVPSSAEPGIPIDEYYRLYIAALLWLSSGTTAGMDQWAGEIQPGAPPSLQELTMLRRAAAPTRNSGALTSSSLFQQIDKGLLPLHQLALSSTGARAPLIALLPLVRSSPGARGGHAWAVRRPSALAAADPAVGCR
ncbi:hypothetical protein MY11210_006520 [Beauveria gryllotalpidicola]